MLRFSRIPWLNETVADVIRDIQEANEVSKFLDLRQDANAKRVRWAAEVADILTECQEVCGGDPAEEDTCADSRFWPERLSPADRDILAGAFRRLYALHLTMSGTRIDERTERF